MGFDGALDPLSVDSRSVAVRRGDGDPLPARRAVVGGRLLVELRVDQALIRDRPVDVFVELSGLPAVDALFLLDGRRLEAPQRLRFEVSGSLETRGSRPTRLVRLGGRPVPPDGPLRLDGPLTMVFEGVLDPATLVPEACPLYPLESGLVLGEPVLPELGWSCMGDRFEITLDPGRPARPLQLDLRRFGLRDLTGRAPEPALVVELRTS
jgi:hypothetical protein